VLIYANKISKKDRGCFDDDKEFGTIELFGYIYRSQVISFYNCGDAFQTNLLQLGPQILRSQPKILWKIGGLHHRNTFFKLFWKIPLE